MQAPWQAVLLLAERDAQAVGTACPRAFFPSCLPFGGLQPFGLLQPGLWLAEQHLSEVENVYEHRGWGTEPQLSLGP